MANIHTLEVARFLFCLSIICSAFCYMPVEEAISFHFPSQTDIQVSGDASIFKDVIQITESQVNASMKDSLGWATYPKSIPLWDNSSKDLVSFSTHFQFSMSRVPGGSEVGDGLAFFLAPFDFQSSDADAGRWLGLFKSETDGNSSNQILAVEFDTFKNEFDPNDNHVGIDVNSIESKVTFSVSDLYDGAALNNGEKWEAWVDYNGTQIQVFLSYNPNDTIPSKPESPVLLYDIDLSQFLPPNVKVGFSASTGVANETHTLHVWNFSCQYSSDVLTPSPAKRHSMMKTMAMSVVIPCVVIIIIIWLVSRWYKSTRKGKHQGDREKREEDLERGGEGEENDGVQCEHKFTHADLRVVTRNFTQVGSFRSVYRGTNEAVTVERVSPTSNKGKKD